jgi:ubiquinone biosynthesis protein
VEERLSQFGLRSGPYRLARNGVTRDEEQIVRLRAALETLGPVFCSFGLYMSTRSDLLAAQDCVQLASVTNHARELSPTLLRELIKRELGCSPDEIYRDFNETPFLSGLLVQRHSAWLHDGRPVMVKLIRPEVEELVYYDSQLLHLLRGAFTNSGCTSPQIESAIEDFISTLQQHTDFLLYADAVAKFEQDMEAFGMLRVPSVQRHFTTSRVLTIERLPGQTLEEILDDSNRLSDDERYALAHRLCVVWLRQSLLGNVFPAEPTSANITILPANQIAFTEGTLASLPIQAKANVWDYMIAALRDDPDRACSSLLKEMEAGDGAVSDVELRQGFRQLVPFRDSDWSHGRDNNSLAEYLIMHWKFMHQSGYQPRAHVPSFYRGLLTIAGIARQLTSKGDPLQRALQDVRVLAETERLRDMLSTSHLTEQMDAYLALMMHFPQRLDQALTAIATREVRAGLQLQETSHDGKKKKSSAVEIAMWLMLGASVLLVEHFEAALIGPRSGRFDVVVIILVGALLLLTINRRR